MLCHHLPRTLTWNTRTPVRYSKRRVQSCNKENSQFSTSAPIEAWNVKLLALWGNYDSPPNRPTDDVQTVGLMVKFHFQKVGTGNTRTSVAGNMCTIEFWNTRTHLGTGNTKCVQTGRGITYRRQNPPANLRMGEIVHPSVVGQSAYRKRVLHPRNNRNQERC